MTDGLREDGDAYEPRSFTCPLVREPSYERLQDPIVSMILGGAWSVKVRNLLFVF